MRLKYKILWFENTDSAYETLRTYVEEYLEDNGFIVEIFRYSNDDDGIETILAKADFDLILMDYGLDGVNGDEVIEKIRNQELFTEVVFYSASPTREIRESIAAKEVDGVYCTSRQISEFEDKVIKVINNTIKKVQDINNMRGLVIAEVIDLEIRIKEMLHQYFQVSIDESYDQKRQKVFLGICEKKVKNNQEESEFISRIHSLKFHDLLNRNYFLTSINLFHGLQDLLGEDIAEMNRILNGKLEIEIKKELEEKRNALKVMKTELNLFEGEIIMLRNMLAHAKEKFDDVGIPYLESLNKQGVMTQFTNEKYVGIRKSIQKHSDNLNNIMGFLNINQSLTAEAASALSDNE